MSFVDPESIVAAESGLEPVTFEGTRLEYDIDVLDGESAGPDPHRLLRRWLEQATAAGLPEPTAMVLATVDATGAPHARTVLLRKLSPVGAIFFTNYDSAKAVQLAAEERCALAFEWLELHRAVRMEGRAQRVSAADSDSYFAGRPRASQLGAWASPQSQPIADRAELLARVAAAEQRFGDGPVTRPPNWGGYEVVVERFEFWQGRPSRLHDRLVYERAESGEGWERHRLAP